MSKTSDGALVNRSFPVTPEHPYIGTGGTWSGSMDLHGDVWIDDPLWIHAWAVHQYQMVGGAGDCDFRTNVTLVTARGTRHQRSEWPQQRTNGHDWRGRHPI
jgi:hypothetical protein